MNPNMEQIINSAPNNLAIQNSLLKMDLKLDHYRNPVCSISGGSDSDIMLDIIERVRGDRPVTYVFFDTGIEYEATKQHLDYLEEHYAIEIIRRKAKVPVPLGCKRHGLPFISKEISQYVGRLQRNEFWWEDKPFEELVKEYPKCQSALRWWCNKKGKDKEGDSLHNICNVSYLKEFLIENPPPIAISDECCKGSKKDPAGRFYTEVGAEIKMTGMRKAEGGVRAGRYATCFEITKKGIADYRPLWYWTDEDKLLYKAHYGVIYSDCYEVWGFKRTGCAGCPFNSRFDEGASTIDQYEPRLTAAIQNIFGASYEYTKAYRAYRDRRKAEDRERRKEMPGQLNIFAEFEEVQPHEP